MCTAVTFKSGDFYFGRTLDNDFSYGEEIAFTPRNFPLPFRNGRVIKRHYAIIGTAHTENGLPLYYDAVNEKGLCAAGLNFVGNAVYNGVAEGADNIAHFEIILWLLSQCDSVDCARKLLKKMNITNEAFSQELPPAQLHWVLADERQCLVIEAVKDRPQIIAEAFQVFECTWDDSLEKAFKDKAGLLEGYPPPYRNFNGITSKFGAHFVLKIDKILIKPRYYDAIVNGVKANGFPAVPVDYGYRDSTNFWYSRFKKPVPEKVQVKEGDVNSVIYAAKRIDPAVKFTDGACAKLTKIPRIFLKAALTQMVQIAKEEGISLIDEAALEKINDKRRKEKKK